MLTKVCVSLFFVCTLLLAGCMKTENSNGTAGDNKTATPASSPAIKTNTPTPTTTISTLSGTDKIGVPECDDFLAKYETCVNDKVPEAQRSLFTATMASWRTAWHNAASTPQGKAALAATCKTATESARTSMTGFHCAF